MANIGIHDLSVLETPVSIIDFETTGFNPQQGRAIEVCVLRCEPNGTDRVVFDTLMDPRGPVSGTDVHGITDEDVRGAPTFVEIWPLLSRSLEGSVVAAYNASFDMRFLEAEARIAGVYEHLPHVCLMYMRPLLDLGKRSTLDAACRDLGIPFETQHVASEDVRATGQLWRSFQSVCTDLGVETFGDLAARKKYKFTRSFAHPLARRLAHGQMKRVPTLRSRPQYGLHGPPGVDAAGADRPRVEPLLEQNRTLVSAIDRAFIKNMDALLVVLDDLDISDDEVAMIQDVRAKFPLKPEQIASLHARVFASALQGAAGDKWLDRREREALKRLHECLRLLGWAPGQ